jgi:MFS family permease
MSSTKGRQNKSFFQKVSEGPIPAFSLVFVDFFGLGCIIPLLPFFTNETGGANAALWLGAILTAQSAGAVIGTILIGALSDHFGRKPIAILSMFGDACMFFGSGFVNTPEQMLAVRLCAGLFCPNPCALGWIVDITPPEQRVLRIGQVSSFMMGGMFFGYSIAAILGHYSSGILLIPMLPPAILALLVGVILIFVPNPGQFGKELTEPLTALTIDSIILSPEMVTLARTSSEPTAAKAEKVRKIRPSPRASVATTRWKAIFLGQFAVGMSMCVFVFLCACVC